MAKQIIYANHKLLAHPSLQALLNQHSDYNWSAYLDRNSFDHGLSAWYSRIGKNSLPFKDTIADVLGLRPPTFDPLFTMEFAEVTDDRCRSLLNTHGNKKWAVLWSGGIDSTVIVSSLIRNLSKDDRERVTIFCNRSSIFENPTFFYNCVQPNFRIADSSVIDSSKLIDQNYCLIDGEPGDQLFSHRLTRLFYNTDLGQKSWSRDPTDLLQLITKLENKQFAHWLYDVMSVNINSVDIPINTYQDWAWWLSFNFCWAPIKLRHHISYDNNMLLNKYFDFFIPWFDTKNYQLWSMCNNQCGIKDTKSPGDCKKIAKEYIYQVNTDDYYLRFKTKTDSVSRVASAENPWFCILDDLSVLSLDTDLDTIIELLPAHLNC